jgi:dihydrofolate reductase
MTTVAIDLRVGGRWRYVMAADGGGEVPSTGEYREIVPNERIVHTEVLDAAPGTHTLTTVTFREAAGRTTVTILVQYGSRQERDAHLDYMGDGSARRWTCSSRPRARPRPPFPSNVEHKEERMGSVIYSMGVSLDGFIAGPDGAIDWAAPDEELMRFHNEQTRQLGAHLCGRGLYQDMLPWETAGESRSDPNQLEFARVWKALPKMVFSSTLETVQGNARLATGGVAEELATLKEQSPKDLSVGVGGAGLASTLVELDLIDEYRLFVSPVVLGGGTRYFPALDSRLTLELAETRTFGARVVYHRYRRV